MTKTTKELHILFGGIIALVGLVSILFSASSSISIYDRFLLDRKGLPEYFLVFKYYMLMLGIPLLQMIGGVLFVAKKRAGWIVTLSTTLYFILLLLITFITDGLSFEEAWYIYLLFGLFLATFIVLLSKRFKERYKPNQLTWLIVLIIPLVILAIRFLI